jgi:hypothetical protein
MRRLRSRPLGAAATLIALVAAAGMVGLSSLSAAVAQDRSLRLRLEGLPAQERALRIVYYTVVASPDVHARQVAAAAAGFSDLSEGVHQVTVWHPVAPADEAGTSFVVPSSVAADATVLRGRLPRGGCGPRRCEALALSGGLRPGRVIRVGPVRVEIVGVGSMRPVALGSDAKLGSRQLLVGALADKQLEMLARAQAGMTSVTTVPLDPARVNAAIVGQVISRLRGAVVKLDRSDPQGLVQATAPTGFLQSIEQRGTAARDRLLLISGQAAALVLAFAMLAASTRRQELRRLRGQLVDLGADRFQAWIAGALEVIVPSLAAAATVFAGLLVAVAMLRPGGTSFAAFVSVALPWSTVLTIVGVLLVSVALLTSSSGRKTMKRHGVGPLEAAAVIAFGVVVWQAFSTGGLSAGRISDSNDRSPVLLMLPALTFLVCAVAMVRVIPLLVRMAERYSRRAPTGVRLAFLAAARRPGEAAVATTFLALAVGAATFSLDYRATLEHQAGDRASFAAGAQLRVVETRPERALVGADGVATQPSSSPTDVAPLTRYALATHESPTPVMRLTVQQLDVSVGGSNREDVPLTLLGIPARRIGEVIGWRSGFTSAPRDVLARRLRPRPVVLRGPQIAANATRLRVWVRTEAPYPTNVVVWFLLHGQDTRVVRIGVVAPSRWKLVTYELPRELRGSEVVGVDLNPPVPGLGQTGYWGTVWLGAVEQLRGARWSAIGSLANWTTFADAFGNSGVVGDVAIVGGPVRSAVRYDRKGTTLSLLRPQLHLPAAIPALASPAVAASAVGGQTRLFFFGVAAPLRVRIVGTASLFPTITGSSRFIVVDYDTAFAALNTLFPGIAPPSEAWFFDAQPRTFAKRLARSPFRLDRLVSVAQLRQTFLSDPLASGARSVLLALALVAAGMGLLGMIVAIGASLRDESAMFAEYEALGIRPSVLARSTALRFAALSTAGLAAGIGGGFLAVRLIGALVAVTGSGSVPIPPIQTVVDWPAVTALLAGIGAVAITASLLLAQRAFGRPVSERLRA